MVLVNVETLVMGVSPSPSVIVLRPIAPEHSNTVAERVMPIWIGSVEAASIGMTLEHVPHARPMTHDLFNSVIKALNASIDRVVVTDVNGSTFYAKLVLSQNGTTVDVDSRPSDAIALALRWNAPIYVDDDVFERASFPYVAGRGKDIEEELREFHSFVEDVTPDDFLKDAELDESLSAEIDEVFNSDSSDFDDWLSQSKEADAEKSGSPSSPQTAGESQTDPESTSSSEPLDSSKSGADAPDSNDSNNSELDHHDEKDDEDDKPHLS
jgi:bifunctional DNase/RNase